MTKINYQALPISAFTTLQKRAFPLYFQTQSLLLALTAATVPPYGLVSLAGSSGDAITLGVAGAMAALNLLRYGPSTSRAMVERTHQGTRSGRRCGSHFLMMQRGADDGVKRLATAGSITMRW